MSRGRGGGSRGSRSSMSRSSGSRGSRSYSSSRSSYSGGSSYGHVHHHRPAYVRRYGMWGPRVVVSDRYYGRASALSVIMGICFFFAFIAIAFIISGSSSMNDLEKDYNYYQKQFIPRAEASGTDMIITGRVTGYYYGGHDMYYIEYEYGRYTSFLEYKYSDSTYSCYTLKEAMDLDSYGWIDLYTTSSLVSASTDTIPVDFKNADINVDGDYLNYRDEFVGGIIGLFVCIAGVIVCCVVSNRISKKESGTISSTATTNPDIVPSQTEATSNYTYCDYCGSKLDRSATNCPNCGSKLIKK